MSRFFVTGDTHGEIDTGKLSNRNFTTHKELTKDDYLIITGDFGCCWYGDKNIETTNPGYEVPPRHRTFVGKDYYMLDWYQSKNFTTLFVDGNHENHKLLNTFPVEEWNGGLVHRIRPTVIHLMRGQVYTIDGKKFFAMGGAKSSDIERRTPDASWWEEELPSEEEIQTAIANLDKHNWKVDYVITHCCGNTMLNKFDTRHYKTDVLTDFLEEIDQKLDYKMWYFGHHHIDEQLDDKHKALYRDIVEILDE